MEIQVSASVGWVAVDPGDTADDAGDGDVEALIERAEAAADTATRAGGDRWERVNA